nr:hypothetical protein [Tanacetum cinerariifolium]
MINDQVGDLSSHTTKYTSPALTQKVFANMRRVGKGFSGVDTLLFEGMLVPQQVHDDVVDDVANDVADAQLYSNMDGKKVVISEASIKRDLQFGDEGGIDCLPNETIFEQLSLMSAKTTAWNEFSSTISSAVNCLATN